MVTEQSVAADSPAKDARPAPRPAASVGWLIAIVIVSLAARVPTLRVPLDQDAAVYTYAADRWLDGGLPYRDAWDHKAPFVYVIYAAVRLVAPVSAATPWSLWLRVASALCDVGTLLLVFALA
ncbi:hypothetical protein HQ576_06360, partial [bacterium]|nr:hypothetical protein [bacterium]